MDKLFTRKLVEIYGEISAVLSGEFTKDFEKLSEFISSSQDLCVFGLGAGRMGYSLQAFIMRLSHMGINAFMIGDTTLPRVKLNDIVIINSSSGETKSIVLLAELAKKHGARLVVITTDAKSKLANLADLTIQIEAIQSTQPMKTVYEQATYILFDMLAAYLIKKLNIDIEFMSNNHSILE